MQLVLHDSSTHCTIRTALTASGGSDLCRGYQATCASAWRSHVDRRTVSSSSGSLWGGGSGSAVRGRYSTNAPERAASRIAERIRRRLVANTQATWQSQQTLGISDAVCLHRLLLLRGRVRVPSHGSRRADRLGRGFSSRTKYGACLERPPPPRKRHRSSQKPAEASKRQEGLCPSSCLEGRKTAALAVGFKSRRGRFHGTVREQAWIGRHG